MSALSLGLRTLPPFKWAVIGGGGAGIITVNELLRRDKNATICWVDPAFQVGDLGEKWSGVSSNTKVDTFRHVLQNFECFHTRPKQFSIEALDGNETCELHHIVTPLQWITERLRMQPQVNAREDTIESVRKVPSTWERNGKKVGSLWELTGKERTHCYAQNVVLATGATPKILEHKHVEVIPLEVALNDDLLTQKISPTDVVGVFGSSHSAMYAVRTLSNMNVKTINFYRSPHRYAIYEDGWIRFDNTGLKGRVADWAKENIDHKLPPTLERVMTSGPEFQKKLASCTKIIYAIGFERNLIPNVEGADLSQYNNQTGQIADGLYGVGIAYPEFVTDRAGNQELSVGLRKFSNYLQRVVPIWIASSV